MALRVAVAVALIAAVCVSAGVDAGHLSPESWPAGELEKYTAANDAYGSPKSALGQRGKGVVAGTSSALAAHVATDVLRKGGNAIDAAIAASLAQVTVAAGAYVSFAGIMTLLHFDAKTGEVKNLNGGYNTVRNEHDANSIPKPGIEPKGRQVLVPGFMAAAEEAHRALGSGKFSFADLLEPAIYFAEEGFPLSRLVAGNLNAKRALVTASDEGRAVFEKEPGVIYAAGDLFKQPSVANLLRNVSASGSQYMYTGDWAQRFVAAVAARGGRMAAEDMAAYRPLWTAPLKARVSLDADGSSAFNYYGPGEPGWGGVQIAETLALLGEMADVITLAAPHDKSGDALFWLVQALRWSPFVQMVNFSAPSLLVSAFPELQGINSDAQRISPAFAKMVWALMSAPNGTEDIAARFKKWVFRGSGVGVHADYEGGVGKHSDGFVVVDGDGNACALVHSINTQPWGTGIFVDGVALPDSAAIQQSHVNRTVPGERLADPTSPGIFTTGDDTPSVLALTSSVGGGLFEVTVEGVYSMLRYARTAGDAGTTGKVQSIEWNGNVYPANQSADIGQFDESIVQRVRALGQPIDEHTGKPGDSTGDKGYWVGIRAPIDASGEWSAFAAAELNSLAEIAAE